MRDPTQDVPLLWRRPWWCRPAALATAWAALLAYGTLLPFDFAPPRPQGTIGAALAEVLASPRWVTAGGKASKYGVSALASDIATNFILYVPFGVLLRFAVWPLVRNGAAAVALAAAIATGWSYALEGVQGLSPTRVASLQDVTLNGGGAVIGAAFALMVRSVLSTALTAAHHSAGPHVARLLDAARALRRRPWARWIGPAAVVALGAAVLLGSGYSASGRRVYWLPFLAPFTRPYDVAAWEVGRSTLLYASLALLFALRATGRGAAGTAVRLALSVAVAALGLEVARCLVHEASIDATEPVLAAGAAVAVLAAAWIGVDLVRRSCRRRRPRPVAVERRRRPHDYRFATGAAVSPPPR